VSVTLDLLRQGFRGADVAILVCFAVLNTGYLGLVLFGWVGLARHMGRTRFAGLDEIAGSPLTRPVSVLMPVRDRAADSVDAVHAMLALRYPEFEVVVIDDGSTDDTFARLREEFDLVWVPKVVPDEVPIRGAIRSVHVSRTRRDSLVVVRKDSGGKTDSLNVGLNFARYPLVCMVDPDAVLDPRALLWAAKPFADDPLGVVATGCATRVVNGCTVVAGRVVDIRMPRGWLARIQVVEHVRALFLGQAGLPQTDRLVMTTGGFGMFRRDLLNRLGGLAYECADESTELVTRLHHQLWSERSEHRIAFVGEPVAWSEAPESLRTLSRERRHWHRGLAETLLRHRHMIGNPHYRQVGLVSLPFQLLFGLVAPIAELAGLVLVPAGVLLAAVDLSFLWWSLLVAYVYPTAVTVIALWAEELAFHRSSRWLDLALAVCAAVFENLGYRQLTAWWGLRGIGAALRNRPATWGKKVHRGFD
jgi:cellulose synthase/poly-beta-1,6-N-acetylglucosamine synthase-like glycosyltransferase